MHLIRYQNPTLSNCETNGSLPSLNSALDRFFNDCYPGHSSRAIELYEDEQNYYISIELPGVKREHVALNTEKNTLSVKAERKTEEGKQQRAYQFERAFKLPEGIDQDHISAKLEDGILTVNLPKAENTKARTIEVN